MPGNIRPVKRPQRKRLPDFAGRMRTMPDEPGAWKLLCEASNIDCLLLLGLGPGNPAELPFVREAEANGLTIYWLDCQPMLSLQTNPLPASWKKTSPDYAARLAARAKIMFYQPGLALAPDYWSSLLANLQKAALPPLAHDSRQNPGVWLPGDSSQLLHQEVCQALRQKGFARVVEAIPTKPDMAELKKIWNGQAPSLAISVNFRGLDSEGKIFELCESLGVPVAIWLVDNPWNLLSGVDLPWWRKADIFVTDASFIGELRRYGASRVFFLPLACASHMWRQPQKHNNGTPVFVGRPCFPQQKSFFSGLRLPENILQTAESMLIQNQPPDYHWWSEQLRISPWPGLAGRKTAFGADIFSSRNRRRWLESCENMEIVGGEIWKDILPQAKILPPVDYYGQLPQIYQDALCCLNITSLLLPQSLSQRHFDVWGAGGFLLSDNTRGLDIFPEELVHPMRLNAPAELSEKLDWLKHNSAKSLDLRMAWRKLIQEKHQYIHRVEEILKILEIII